MFTRLRKNYKPEVLDFVTDDERIEQHIDFWGAPFALPYVKPKICQKREAKRLPYKDNYKFLIVLITYSPNS